MGNANKTEHLELSCNFKLTCEIYWKLRDKPSLTIPLSEVGAIPPPSVYFLRGMCAGAGFKDAKQLKVFSLTPARHILCLHGPTMVSSNLPTCNSEEPQLMMKSNTFDQYPSNADFLVNSPIWPQFGIETSRIFSLGVETS